MKPTPLNPSKVKNLRDLFHFLDEEGKCWFESVSEEAGSLSHVVEDGTCDDSDDS